MTKIEAVVPGTHCGWAYETKEPADVERWLGFLRNRNFTEVLNLREEIPFILTCPGGAECTRGWFLDTDQ